MKLRQHAYLARALQDACGGPDACLNILEASPFPIGRTHLYDTRDPSTPRTMPIGAIEVLETLCQEKIYTGVMCAWSAPPSDAECVVSESCELTETVATLQRLIREAAKDDDISENEKREIEPTIIAVERLCLGLRTAMDIKSTDAATNQASTS